MTLPERNGVVKIPGWFLGILVIVLIALVAWGAHVQERISVQETRYESIKNQLDRIEIKLDSRMDKNL